MTVTIDLPSDLETELVAEAARLKLPLDEYVVRLLAEGRGTGTGAATESGADLVAYWRREELIGTRPDIGDASAHARTLRAEAERRGQPGA